MKVFNVVMSSGINKRKQKFAGSFAQIGSILCELVVVISN